MRKTLVTLGVATACLLAPAAAANAADAHHGPQGTVLGSSPLPGAHGVTTPGHECSAKCRPAKTPPASGWPCAKTKSCAGKHHYPVCPLKVTPPVVTPPSAVKPLPPVISKAKPVHHAKPKARVARVRLTAYTTPTAVPQLAMTGVSEGLVLTGLAGGAFVFIGAGLIWLPRGFSRNVTGPKHKELSK